MPKIKKQKLNLSFQRPEEVIELITKKIEQGFHFFNGWGNAFEHILDTIYACLTFNSEGFNKATLKLGNKAKKVAYEVLQILIKAFYFDQLIFDFLGEVYMRIGRIGKLKSFGQEFTPPGVADLLTLITGDNIEQVISEAKSNYIEITESIVQTIVDEVRGESNSITDEMITEIIKKISNLNKRTEIHDPCCGSGALLLAWKRYIVKNAGIEALKYFSFSGQDIDYLCIKMLNIQMILTDYRYMTNHIAILGIGLNNIINNMNL
ncbi:MAG: N-6 DNA methylase [Promethearchaeota archaeon]